MALVSQKAAAEVKQTKGNCQDGNELVLQGWSKRMPPSQIEIRVYILNSNTLWWIWLRQSNLQDCKKIYLGVLYTQNVWGKFWKIYSCSNAIVKGALFWTHSVDETLKPVATQRPSRKNGVHTKKSSLKIRYTHYANLISEQ